MSWHLAPMCSFDTETTGVDAEQDRIVSAAAIAMDEHGAIPTEWLSDVDGIEIPADASAIHGISTERARAEGQPATEVIIAIVEELRAAVAAGIPIVGHNVPFDLTILDRETRRHLGTPLYEILEGAPLVIDTAVLDKVVIPFRRRVSEKQGARQLITAAQVYGLGWDAKAAHGATYDALMAGRLAWNIGHIAHLPRAERPEWVRRTTPNRFQRLAGLDLAELHDAQVTWARLQAESYQEYLRDPVKAGDKYDEHAVIDGTWPLRPVPAAGGASA